MGQGAAGATGASEGIGGLAGFMGAASPFIGIASAGLNIGMSLAEASKQKELQRAADRQAEKSAAEQERLMSQNFFEGLQVPMQAYDREFRETTAQQQQAMSALQEGDPRLLLGGVGKVQAVAADQEAKTREALGKDLFDIGKLQAVEAGQTNDQLAGLEGKRLAGAQEASAAAQAASLQNQQKALGAGGDLIKGLGNLVSEYSDNGQDQPQSISTPSIASGIQPIGSQLQSSTSNVLSDMQKKYGWMTSDLSKFGAARS